MKPLLCVLFLIFSLATSFAQDRYLPALFNVSGVSPDDILNVRAGPGTSYPVVHTFEHNRRSISVLQTNDTGNWGLIGFGEGSGWVSMQFMQLQPDQDALMLPQPLMCFGTEPFWSLEIAEDTAKFGDFDIPERTLDLKWQGTADGMLPYFYGVRLEADGQQIQAVVKRSQCSDGMSDRIFGFDIHAILSGNLGNRILAGCCQLQ